MSIIVENEYGWVVDHRAATVLHMSRGNTVHSTEAGYEGLTEMLNQVHRACCYKKDLFKIERPFRMDSQVTNKPTAAGPEDPGCSTTQKRRRKKRKLPMNEGEILAQRAHEKIRPHLLAAHESLCSVARKHQQYFHDLDSDCMDDNNAVARAAVHIPTSGQSLAELCRPCIEHNDCDVHRVFYINEDTALPTEVPVNEVWKYTCDVPRVVQLSTGRYIIPPSSSFLLSCLTQLPQRCTALGKFDLIVMDPPWENKSVKRKKMYNTVGDSHLLTLPLPQLCRPGCLVVVWVTNRQRQIDFVYDHLFPAWSVRPLTKWYWLKVTTSGEMVYQFDSPHKKPYESIILGRYEDHSTPNHSLNIDTNSDVTPDPCSTGTDTTCVEIGIARDSDVKPVACNKATEPDCVLNVARYGDALLDTLNKTTDTCSSDVALGMSMDSEAHPETHDRATDICDIAGDSDRHSVDLDMTRDSDAKRDTPDIATDSTVVLKSTRHGKTMSYTSKGADTEDRARPDDIGDLSATIPEGRVIVSIPCSIHSKKPPLFDIVKSYLPPSPDCLELFARNLVPGWTSWGNEVLEHQHTDYFEGVG